MLKVPKISIIVPVYKVEIYLKECLDSILNQTYENIELILVNDGSPDSSGDICESYKEKDSRIRVFHQENKGVSKARNFGITEATGDYVCFIDSDDWIQGSYLADFFYNGNYNADVYLQGYINKYADEKLNNQINFITNEFYTVQLLKEGYIYSERNNIINSPCFKLFRRDIIKENNIEFDPSICYGEDHLFVLNYFLHIKNMSVSNQAGYHYVHRGNICLTNKYVSHDKLFYYAKKIAVIRKGLIKKFNIEDEVFEYFVRKQFVLYSLLSISSMYSDESGLSKSKRKSNLLNYITYLEKNKFLENLNFNNYLHFTLFRVVKSKFFNKDLVLFVFLKSRNYLLRKLKN
jgi:glycosyltransferase involved in cell wall biosynthesis